MAGFSFHSGGKRCIRPILEKYQSGKEHTSLTEMLGPSVQCEPQIAMILCEFSLEVPCLAVHTVA